MMQRSPSAPKSPERARAERLGRRAEAIAALWFRCQFYRVIASRYKTPVGEIDLIVARGQTIVFVEVKTRASAAGEANALAAVNRQRLVRAAQYFRARHPRDAQRPMRFDVFFLAPRTWPRHVRNAFLATGF
jgi:putative endonuclease